MDRILDAMHKVGIKVIFGTPTYSIPSWMAAKHPEILAHTIDDQQRYYGIRQNMDLVNPMYRRYCERIIRKLMEHYALQDYLKIKVCLSDCIPRLLLVRHISVLQVVSFSREKDRDNPWEFHS